MQFDEIAKSLVDNALRSEKSYSHCEAFAHSLKDHFVTTVTAAYLSLIV